MKRHEKKKNPLITNLEEEGVRPFQFPLFKYNHYK
jgi:hypothetical protein